MSQWTTADLCDEHGEGVQIAAPGLRDFGGRRAFAGLIATVRAPEDNSLVRTALAEPGQGRVLVIDGGGSQRCALLGDQLARLAVEHGWAGVVVHGCIRDSAVIGELDLGVKALATHPLKSVKRNEGQRDLAVRFLGVEFRPGAWLYADADGVLVAERRLDRATE